MFLSDQVIITLMEKQKVKGHVVRAPDEFGPFFGLFRRLGVSEEPRADHYAKALERLYEESQGRPLEPNELELVKRSVDNLFTCLKAEHIPDNTLSVKSVYLPAESITAVKETQNSPMSVYLADSRQLILEVTDEQKNRVRSPSQHLAVFLGFKKLELEARDLHREVNGRLPDAYKMKLWQEVVKETLTESCKTLARADTDTLFFEGRMHSPEVLNAVLRLVNHQKLKEDQEFPEDAVKEVEKKLLLLRIRKVTNLETVLSMNGSELPGTQEKTDFFLEQQPQVEQGVYNAIATLYADGDQNLSQDPGKKEFMVELNTAVFLVVGTLDGIMLDCCLQNPSAAATFLNKKGVPPLTTSRETQPTVFPAPGTFVPESMHGILNNNIDEFHVGEHVAYELFDPCLDIAFLETNVDDDLAKVLKDIRRELRDIWSAFTSDKDRLRAVKRLLLEWHPDKNQGREEFCTKVFQRSSDFFRTSTSNPQPEEGRRWMRQAKLDLDAAVKTLRGGDALMYNWACYQAHQTAEKALKAVAFRRDAWACRKTSHSLRDLAGSLSDSEITEPAGQLDDLVQYHTRMRYPDLCTFPKIPAEVYGQDEATKACDFAGQILKRAQTLVLN
nr:hypothetical protein BaRGS_015382 [Batillaria attramentaria]